VASLMGSSLAWYMAKMTWISWKFEEKSEGAAATLLWKPQLLVAIGSIIFAVSLLHGLVKVLVSRNPDAAAARPKELTAE
jgi:hypothetical protein